MVRTVSFTKTNAAISKDTSTAATKCKPLFTWDLHVATGFIKMNKDDSEEMR